MAWGADFLDALSETRQAPIYAVQFWTGESEEGVGAKSGELTTHPIDTGLPVLSASTIRIGGHSVTPRSWQYQTGSWSFTVEDPDDDPLTWAATLRRGTLVRLYVGFSGWTFEQFEPVTFGRIQGVRTARRGIYEVAVWGINTALRSRLVTALAFASDAGEQALCHTAGETALITTTAYTAGDSTLTLSSATAFEAEGGTGSTGVVKVTGDSGAQFYLTFTGKSGAQLTGVSASGQFGTTAENAAINNVCTAVSYYTGHPIQVAARALTSTGAGTNGPWDTNAASMGLGVPIAMLEKRDFYDIANDVVQPASGAYTWEVLVEEPISDAWAWLQSLLGEAGIWLVERQGLITVRACQDIATGSTVRHMSDVVIRDSHVISLAVEWFAPEVSAEYTAATVYTATANTSTTTTAIATLPAQWNYNYDVTDRVDANESAIRTEMLSRLDPWVLDVPQVYDAELPLWAWQLAPGDVARLELSDAWPAGGFISTVNGASSKPAMVSAVAPSLEGHKVRVRFMVLPTDKRDNWSL